MIGCLWTRVRMQRIIALYYEFETVLKVRKTAKITKRYNQAPHLTQDTTWESNKTTINIINKSQQVTKRQQRTDAKA